MVRMEEVFSLRLPLINGQSNFGSMDGDRAAAMRYTEARMAKSAHALLEDIDKDTVDFRPNYDETVEEPSVLPAGFPNLLVNGAGGIAVGMATNIPPHNLGEVIDACCAYIDDPEIGIGQLIENHIQGPDFPTVGLIMGRSGVLPAYPTGRGARPRRGHKGAARLLRPIEREARLAPGLAIDVQLGSDLARWLDGPGDGAYTKLRDRLGVNVTLHGQDDWPRDRYDVAVPRN